MEWTGATTVLVREGDVSSGVSSEEWFCGEEWAVLHNSEIWLAHGPVAAPAQQEQLAK